jgi:hypothetical protein
MPGFQVLILHLPRRLPKMPDIYQGRHPAEVVPTSRDLPRATGSEVSKDCDLRPIRPAPAKNPTFAVGSSGGHPGLRPAEHGK